MTTSLSPSSSLDMLSPISPSTRWASDSLSDEDEIVWSLSSSAMLSSSSLPPPHTTSSPLSEAADYVLVPRIDAIPTGTAGSPASPPARTSDDAIAIAEGMAALSLSSGAAAGLPSTASGSTTTTITKKKSKKNRQAGKKSASVSMPPGGADLRPSVSALAPAASSKAAEKAKAAART